jgi:hypothetical protein
MTYGWILELLGNAPQRVPAHWVEHRRYVLKKPTPRSGCWKGSISTVNKYFYAFILIMLLENGRIATRFFDDCEVLEIILRAEFKTVELE